MIKLILLLTLLFACGYTNPAQPEQPKERTFWSICWTSEGDMVLPPDFEFVNPACENPEIVKWDLPIRVGYKQIPKFFHVFIERSFLVWNNETGIELFVIDHDNPNVKVLVVPEHPFAYAWVDLHKKPTLTGEVSVGLDTWLGPRLYFTLAHEFGHILGLAHDESRDSWMFSGHRNARMNVSAADINALRNLYNVRE